MFVFIRVVPSPLCPRMTYEPRKITLIVQQCLAKQWGKEHQSLEPFVPHVNTGMFRSEVNLVDRVDLGSRLVAVQSICLSHAGTSLPEFLTSRRLVICFGARYSDEPEQHVDVLLNWAIAWEGKVYVLGTHRRYLTQPWQPEHRHMHFYLESRECTGFGFLKGSSDGTEALTSPSFFPASILVLVEVGYNAESDICWIATLRDTCCFGSWYGLDSCGSWQRQEPLHPMWTGHCGVSHRDIPSRHATNIRPEKRWRHHLHLFAGVDPMSESW